MVSHHPKDIEHGYCGNCHQFVVDIPFQWLWDETKNGNKDAEKVMMKRQEDYWQQRANISERLERVEKRVGLILALLEHHDIT